MKENSKIIDINKNLTGAAEEAEKIFRESGIFIYPTDTIYGIGGDPFSEASQKITKIKGRDEGKKFILLVASIEVLSKFVNLSDSKQIRFLDNLWPNPISIILKLNKETSERLGADTAAFRIPKHNFCKELLNRVKTPLISTSVNKSGYPPLDNLERIKEEFNNDVNAIFYEEKVQPSAASTLIDLTSSAPVLLREGYIKFSDILKVFSNVFNKNFVE